jgi:hypothetical protein
MRVVHVNYGDLFLLVPRLPRRPISGTLTAATSPSVHPRLSLIDLALHLPAGRMEMTTRPKKSSRNGCRMTNWVSPDFLIQLRQA